MIRKFESFSTDDFEIGKREIKDLIRNLIEIYEDFTNDISPKHWRRTGHHITELRKMMDEIDPITPITSEESEIDWVKKSRFSK